MTQQKIFVSRPQSINDGLAQRLGKMFSEEDLHKAILENYTEEEQEYLLKHNMEIRVLSVMISEDGKYHPYYFTDANIVHDATGIRFMRRSDTDLLQRAVGIIGNFTAIVAVHWETYTLTTHPIN